VKRHSDDEREEEYQRCGPDEIAEVLHCAQDDDLRKKSAVAGRK